MKKSVAISRIRECVAVTRAELKYIFNDAGAVLILMGAVVIYSIVYSFAYNPEVLRNVPLAVVDMDKTPSSREFARLLDASPDVDIKYKASSLEEGRELFMRREVYGILYIQDDFEKNILSNKQAIVGIYADGGYFLMYKQVFMDIVETMNRMNNRIEMERFLLSGVPYATAEAISDPVAATSRSLFNPYGGYGSFVMPAILVTILQQTLLIGIGMVGGTWRERRLYRRMIPSGGQYMSALPLVLGKTVAYLAISVCTAFFMFGLHYKTFEYPNNGSAADLTAFLIPYILSVIFLGITLSSLFRHRENSLLFLLFTSIPFVMISGVSVPREAMPEWLFQIGRIIPCSPGINGFVRIRTMGASLSEVVPEYVNLWILTGVYFLTACLGMRRLAREEFSGESDD